MKETIGKILFYGVGNFIAGTLTAYVVVRDFVKKKIKKVKKKL